MKQLTELEIHIQEMLNMGNFQEAEELIVNANDNICLVHRAIFQAAIAFASGNEHLAWASIKDGLKEDNSNYELYLMLGEYYASRNLQQAYLCYENALFYCDVPQDSIQIQLLMNELLDQGVFVPKSAIVILSYNLLEMTKECIKSIRKTTPESAREIIVVDNASNDGSVEWLKMQSDIKLICNSVNMGFPKGCNQGILCSEQESDIFLLNNDTILTDNALFWLRMGLYEDNKNGSAGCVSNYVSNFQAVIENGKMQEEYLDFAKGLNIPMENPYLNKVHLVGFALLLKRSVLDVIGLLDERFSPGNYEDNDICLRISLIGYRNVLCKNSFIIHWGSKSFNKNPERYRKIMENNRNKFFEKWKQIGINQNNYLDMSMDTATLLNAYQITNEKIMVIGTKDGSCLGYLKNKFPFAQIYGVEQQEFLAKIADTIVDTVWTNLDEWKSDELEEMFDIIIINNELERTQNPEKVLIEITKMLKSEGKMIISFANKNHFTRIGNSVSKKLFSKKEMKNMYFAANLIGCKWGYTQIKCDTSELQETLSMTQKQYPELLEELNVYQWFSVAERRREDIHFENKMVVCIPTYENPNVVEDVLSHCAETYKRYGLDVYYFDSSKDNKTKYVIEKYQRKGYDNLYYIHIDSERPVVKKFEDIFLMRYLKKEYSYMWYLRDRCWCEEITLLLMYRAVTEKHDLIFFDIGHRESSAEVSYCQNADEFYHRCGDYATSMDATIYNVNSMLRENFDLWEFTNKYQEGSRKDFYHFLVIFNQLAKKRVPDICLLAGERVTILHSALGHSSWNEQRFCVWGQHWIQANEMLPACYTQRDEIIKRTASFPWILGDVNILVDMQQRGILTLDKYVEIKVFWKRVSTIPLEILRVVASGEYYEYFSPLQLKYGNSDNLKLLIQIYKAILDGKMQIDKVPLKKMEDMIVKLLLKKKREQTDMVFLGTAIKNIQNQLTRNTQDIFGILAQVQFYISLVMLLEE